MYDSTVDGCHEMVCPPAADGSGFVKVCNASYFCLCGWLVFPGCNQFGLNLFSSLSPEGLFALSFSGFYVSSRKWKENDTDTFLSVPKKGAALIKTHTWDFTCAVKMLFVGMIGLLHFCLSFSFGCLHQTFHLYRVTASFGENNLNHQQGNTAPRLPLFAPRPGSFRRDSCSALLRLTRSSWILKVLWLNSGPCETLMKFWSGVLLQGRKLYMHNDKRCCQILT